MICCRPLSLAEGPPIQQKKHAVLERMQVKCRWLVFAARIILCLDFPPHSRYYFQQLIGPPAHLQLAQLKYPCLAPLEHPHLATLKHPHLATLKYPYPHPHNVVSVKARIRVSMELWGMNLVMLTTRIVFLVDHVTSRFLVFQATVTLFSMRLEKDNAME